MRHRVQDVVPARRPAHFVVLLKHDRVGVRDLEFPFLISADAQRRSRVGRVCLAVFKTRARLLVSVQFERRVQQLIHTFKPFWFELGSHQTHSSIRCFEAPVGVETGVVLDDDVNVVEHVVRVSCSQHSLNKTKTNEYTKKLYTNS